MIMATIAVTWYKIIIIMAFLWNGLQLNAYKSEAMLGTKSGVVTMLAICSRMSC